MDHSLHSDRLGSISQGVGIESKPPQRKKITMQVRSRSPSITLGELVASTYDQQSQLARDPAKISQRVATFLRKRLLSSHPALYWHLINC
jgi:ubiquinone biosynthesis protein Coq4